MKSTVDFLKVVGNVITAIAPPDKDGRFAVLVVTGIIVFVNWVVVFHFFKPNTRLKTRHTWLSIFATLGGVSSVVYGYELFTYTYLDNDFVRHAKGTVENEIWKTATNPETKHLHPEFSVDSTLTEEEQLRGIMGYDATVKWTEKSIRAVENCLFAVWIPVVVFVVAALMLLLASRRGTRKILSPENLWKRAESKSAEE